MNIKWIMAIVIVFGLLTMFYVLQWAAVLKPLLVLSCVALIGAVLLQSGKGGGLAAIGGLADQSAFGTKTSTVLSKVTYLIGAAFIFNTLLLTKLTLTSMHDSGVLMNTSEMIQEATLHEDAGRDHEGHDHTQGIQEAAVDDSGAMTMKAVDVMEVKQENKEENKEESKEKETKSKLEEEGEK